MSDKPRYLLVDLGGTQVRVALGDSAGDISGRQEERTRVWDGPNGVISQIARMARDACAAVGAPLSDISCLVIGAPGPLDPTPGIVFGAPNMPGWDEVHLADDLRSALDLPVFALNDANAAALGEYSFGAGRGHKVLVYLTVSTGIGAGVVLDGRLIEGVTGMAGEIGHMTIDRHGPPCPCGSIGCLEVLASGTSIARRFRDRLAEGETSAVTEWLEGREPTAADVSRGAREGDPLATAVFADAAEALGFGLTNVIHIFNPDIIVVGGGVARAGRLLFDPVEDIIAQRTMEIPQRAVRVVPAELGDDAGLFGALAVALERCG